MTLAQQDFVTNGTPSKSCTKRKLLGLLNTFIFITDCCEGKMQAREVQGGASRVLEGGISREVQGGPSREVQGGTSREVQGGTSREVQGGTSRALEGLPPKFVTAMRWR